MPWQHSSSNLGKPTLATTMVSASGLTSLQKGLVDDNLVKDRRLVHRGQEPPSGKSQGADVNSPHQEGASQRVKVPGVRRVWGTKRDATTSVVLQTVKQLIKIDPDKKDCP